MLNWSQHPRRVRVTQRAERQAGECMIPSTEDHRPRDREELRREAEERVRQAESPDAQRASDVDVRALLHELQVHQIELETQNEELVYATEEAEQALSKYSDLYDFAPVGYVTIDEQGIVIEANITIATMLGVPRSRLVNHPLKPYISRDTASAFDKLCHGLVPGQETELVILRDMEERVHVLAKASPFADGTDRPVSRVAITDISQLKAVEAELRKAHDELEGRVLHRTVQLAAAQREAELRAAELDVMMEAVPIGLLIADDPECKTVRANLAARELLNAAPGANVSKSAPEAERLTHWQEMKDGVPIPPDELPMQQACRGVHIRHYEMDLVFADGEVKNVLGNASPLFDERGRPRGSMAVLLDITQRKAAEQELANARAEAQGRAAELESFVANLADGVILFGLRGEITFINDVGMDLLGVPLGYSSQNWMQNTRLDDLDGKPIPEEQWPVCRALSGESVADMRAYLVLPWGKTVLLSMSSSPVFGDENTVVGATFVFRDQSERVRIEKDRQALLERERHIAEVLEHTVIPPPGLRVAGLDLAVRYEPSSAEAGIGGDFYDIFELGDGKVGVLIGDVTGKGLAAAVGITAVRHSIRSYAYLDPRPSRVLTLANDALWRSLIGSDELGMLTAFFAVIDTRFGGVSYASGGHEPALLKAADGRVERLDVRGPLLGVMAGVEYDERSRRLQSGDKVVMVTDGITEARPCPEELFGVEGVERFLSTFSAQDVDSIADGIVQSARDHAGGRLLDDAAVVVVALKNGRFQAG